MNVLWSFCFSWWRKLDLRVGVDEPRPNLVLDHNPLDLTSSSSALSVLELANVPSLYACSTSFCASSYHPGNDRMWSKGSIGHFAYLACDIVLNWCCDRTSFVILDLLFSDHPQSHRRSQFALRHKEFHLFLLSCILLIASSCRRALWELPALHVRRSSCPYVP